MFSHTNNTEFAHSPAISTATSTWFSTIKACLNTVVQAIAELTHEQPQDHRLTEMLSTTGRVRYR